MKQLYYILICCAIVPSLLAQSGFNKLFSEDVTHISAFHDVVPDEEGFVTIGTFLEPYDSLYYIQSLSLNKYNFEGELLDSVRLLGRHGKVLFIGGKGRIVQTPDGGYMTYARYSEMDSNYLIFFDEHRRYTHDVGYRPPGMDYMYASGLVQLADGDLILFGEHNDPRFQSGIMSYIMRTDAAGTLKWVRKFGDPIAYNEIIEVKSEGDLTCLVIGAFKPSGFEDWWGYGYQLYFDALGNMVDSVYTPMSDTNYIAWIDLVRTSDGGNIVSLIKNYTPKDGNFPLMFSEIMRLDQQGDTLWINTYDEDPYIDTLLRLSVSPIIETRDGNYAGLVQSSAGYWIRNIKFLKFDGDGNTLWETTALIDFDIDVDTVFLGNYSNRFYRMTELNDGGLVGVGSVKYHTELGTLEFGWMVKVCENGGIDTITCLPTNIEFHDTTIPLVHSYPNPTTSMVTIDIPTSMNASSVEVLDIHGRSLVLESIHSSTPTMSVQDLPQGLYIIQVKDARGLLLAQGKIVKGE